MNNPFNQILTFILKIRPFRVFDLKKRYDSSNSNKDFVHSDMKHIYGFLRIFAFRRRIATSHFHFRQLFALSHLRPKGVRGSNETPCLPMPSVRVWNYYHKNILELTVSAWYLLWLDWLQVYFLSGCIKYYIYLVLNIFSHSFFKKSECVHTTTDGTKSQTVQPVLSIRTSWKCHYTLNLPVNLHSF